MLTRLERSADGASHLDLAQPVVAADLFDSGAQDGLDRVRGRTVGGSVGGLVGSVTAEP